MRKREKDYEELETSPELKRRGFRRISRPKRLDAVLEDHRAKRKSRVTIYFDKDLIERFKTLAEEKGVGYQTLMNEALRRSADLEIPEAEGHDLKESILKDKRFLKRLKSALAA